MKRIIVVILLLTLALLLATLTNGVSLAYEQKEVEIHSPILAVETEPRSISIPITIVNLLNEARDVLLRVVCPADWRYSILFREYNVSKLSLRGSETIDLTLVLEPGPEITSGEHHFNIAAYRGTQIISNVLTISVKIVKPVAAVSIEATSTEVSGSPGSIFSFRFNIKNNSYKDLTLKLGANIPEGWYNLGFKPSPYETKVISEITVRARSTYWSAAFDVFCPEGQIPGVYPVSIILEEPVAGIHEEFVFRAVVTGTPKVSLKTEGDLLSYNVEAGGEIEIPLIIENVGTVPLREISIYCYAPTGWKTAINPNKISSLPVKEKASATLYISPHPGAIAGDYSVSVRAWSLDATQEITLRITVTKTTYWGVIGIIVIVIAVFGLMTVFWRYGRL